MGLEQIQSMGLGQPNGSPDRQRDFQKRLVSRKQNGGESEVHLPIPTRQAGMCMCLPFLWFPKDDAPCHITKTHPSIVTLRPSPHLGKIFLFTSMLIISSLFFLRIWISRRLLGIQSTAQWGPFSSYGFLYFFFFTVTGEARNNQPVLCQLFFGQQTVMMCNVGKVQLLTARRLEMIPSCEDKEDIEK